MAQEEAPTRYLPIRGPNDPVKAYTEYWKDLLAPWKLLIIISSGDPVEAPTKDPVEAQPEQV